MVARRAEHLNRINEVVNHNRDVSGFWGNGGERVTAWQRNSGEVEQSCHQLSALLLVQPTTDN